MQHRVALERPAPAELAALLVSVGWGDSSLEDLARSINAYPCTICARSAAGTLVGYLSAFSDEVASTMLGELIVSPGHQRRGIASAMLSHLERRYPNAPIYINALGASKAFYAARGFKVPRGEVTVMFKRPGAASSSPNQAREA